MPRMLFGRTLAAALFGVVQIFHLVMLSTGVAYAQAGARPGEVLGVWPLEGGAPAEARAYRIMYRSTGLAGEPIEVSGAVIFPSGPAPAGGRDVVAWAHPTSGVVDRCAPTRTPGMASRIPGLEAMLERGYVVVATDYPGLGTPGVHPYLIGVSEARAVIDSVRAVRDLSAAAATRRFAVWGHSQGGHAALFVGQLAASYAPELELVGVAAAAPATYLADLFMADRDTPAGRALSAMTLVSWSQLYNLPVAQVVDQRALPAIRRVASECIDTLPALLKVLQAQESLERTFLRADPLRLPAWRAIMNRNTPGQSPPGAPVFVAQGTADEVVPMRITRRFVRRLCAGGARVTYVSLDGVSHALTALDSQLQAISWIADRFRRKPVPNDC